MKVLYLGSLMLDYEQNKFKSFKNYIEFKEKVDYIFEEYNVELEKTPEKPTLEDSYLFYNFTLEYESNTFRTFMAIIEDIQLKDSITFQLEINYTKKEMEQAPLLSMATYYNFYATNVKFPSEFGTEYEKALVCSKCGSIVYKQISNLYWNTAQMKKKLLLEIPANFYSGSHAIIITERLANIFKEQGFTGYSLEPVIHVGKKDKEIKCFQMIINHTMPPLSEKMPYIIDEDDCLVCTKKGRIKFFPLYYDEASLSHYEDFNLSHEENIGKKSRQSLVLVSQRVKHLFDTLKIKPVYKPVVIVKEE
ncbi:hypothetical protein [Anaerotignum propionicum]|uniref:Uncharacterized protein n=1 Tax=Anaerotignum propionicum DSM 1682 TaxID=991789 RepID=A0A0X8VAS3_ANAPI|nr:hypothetical protein [Anaerotignum propionicum]AMJ41580.1 hypothetical protein CPRO_19980 [Anaerotignum propionicum DSM 1682]SHE86490.1 hypothetical protein SAMN02745151_02019 [[Clostridium] propionicum DSM 1682] [Anaerotignum propionicum DSM 1682]